jgi:AraC family transcriptional regulator of arabinose operon
MLDRLGIIALPLKHTGEPLVSVTGMNRSAPDPRITWLVAHLQQHLGAPLRVAELAALVNLSPSRLRALFVAQTGSAPAPYLRRLRLRRARLLVERTFLSIKEIMALVGYNDPSHFARDFRREHGLAPTEVRRLSPSVDPLTHRRIGSPRGRDPGRRCA